MKYLKFLIILVFSKINFLEAQNVNDFIVYTTSKPLQGIKIPSKKNENCTLEKAIQPLES